MSAYWNFPVLGMGVLAAIGLLMASYLLGTFLPTPYKYFAGALLWMGAGAFYLGMRDARHRWRRMQDR